MFNFGFWYHGLSKERSNYFYLKPSRLSAKQVDCIATEGRRTYVHSLNYSVASSSRQDAVIYDLSCILMPNEFPEVAPVHEALSPEFIAYNPSGAKPFQVWENDLHACKSYWCGAHCMMIVTRKVEDGQFEVWPFDFAPDFRKIGRGTFIPDLTQERLEIQHSKTIAHLLVKD